jgi:lysylphosphatidylglycerol synthetase-like protein (DUF2156 family)
MEPEETDTSQIAFSKKNLTIDFTPVYNSNIYRAKVYLLFTMMSVAESKNVYQRCFIALFVLFLVTIVAQLACLLGLHYLSATQAALALKVVLIFSIVMDTACVVLGVVAAVYVSSLATVLCVFGSLLLLLIIVVVCVLCILAASKGGGSSGGSSYDRNCCCFCWSGPSTSSSGDCDNCCQCEEPGLTISAFTVTFIGFASLAIAIYCLFWHCQWTMIHEHEHDNAPFLAALLVCSALKTLLVGLVISCKFTTTTCCNGSNDEEDKKKLLGDGDASLDTFRRFPK